MPQCPMETDRPKLKLASVKVQDTLSGVIGHHHMKNSQRSLKPKNISLFALISK